MQNGDVAEDLTSEVSVSSAEEDVLASRAKIEDTGIEIDDIRNFMSVNSAGNTGCQLTRRALRMNAKQQIKSRRRATAESRSDKANPVICPVVKPGRKDGRVARALLDPYGCHRSDEHFI
jgi:hypothetical protein